MTEATQQFFAFIFGVIFIITLLIIAVVFPTPTPFQYIVFRIVLALSAAGVGAMIPGLLQINIANWLRAGGALAVFVLVYLYNPVQLVSSDPRSPNNLPETVILFKDKNGNHVDSIPGDLCPLNKKLLPVDRTAIEVRESVFKKVSGQGLQEGNCITVLNLINSDKWIKGSIFQLLPKSIRSDSVLSREHCSIAMGEKSRVSLGLPEKLGNVGSRERKGHKLQVILSCDWTPTITN